MESADNTIGSGSGLATSEGMHVMHHGASKKRNSVVCALTHSSASSGTVETLLDETAASSSTHHPHLAPSSSQLATSGADAEAQCAVLGSRGATAGGTATPSIMPMPSEAPAAGRTGIYPSSRRQGVPATSIGARPTLPGAGAGGTAAATAHSGVEDTNSELLPSRRGYSYHSSSNTYYNGEQANPYSNSNTCGYYMGQGEYPGAAGGSSASTGAPYGSTLGPMAGSSGSGGGGSGGGAGDGQTAPGYFFPCHPSTSATASRQQHPNQYGTRYQQQQRQQQQQQQQPYGPPICSTDQGSRTFPSYYSHHYQPKQHQMQRQQQMRSNPSQVQSSSQSTLGGEAQYSGYYYSNGADQRRGHTRAVSSTSSRMQYYNLPQHQQQQHGSQPPSSSGEGDTIYNQGGSAQCSIQGGGTAEDYYQQYAPCPGYPYQGFPPTLQSHHSSFMCGEGQPSIPPTSQGYAQLTTNRSGQPCSATASPYGVEREAMQGSFAARYAGEANGLPDNRGINMYSSEGGGSGRHVYGATAAVGATPAGNGSAGVGSGGASGGYYATGYPSGYTSSVPNAFRTRSVSSYTYESGGVAGTPFDCATGKGAQTPHRGSRPAPQKRGGSEVEGGGPSYPVYAANGCRDYHHVAANPIGGSGTATGYGYGAGHAMPPQPPMPYQTPFVFGEGQHGSSATASPPVTESCRGSEGLHQPQPQHYNWGGNFCATDPRYGGVGEGNGIRNDVSASAYDPQHPQQKEHQGHYRSYSGPSQPQHRGDTRSGGTSMHVSRYSPYAPQQPVTARQWQDVVEGEGEGNRAERPAWTQASDNTTPATSVRDRGHGRSSSSSGNDPIDSDAGGSVAPTPSRKNMIKMVNSGTARTPLAANVKASRKAMQGDEGSGVGGKRSAALNTVAPASAKETECPAQTSPQKVDAPVLDVTLLPHEPLVSLVIRSPSMNSPRHRQPPKHKADKDKTPSKTAGMSRDEVDLEQAPDRHMLAKGGVIAAVHDSSGSLLTGPEKEVDEEADVDCTAANLKEGVYRTTTPTVSVAQIECDSAEVFSDGGRCQPRQSSSSTERSAALTNPLPHSSLSGNSVQSFLRRSPITQCTGTPFHTYICGAIVEQAAHLQTSMCAPPLTGRGIVVSSVGADTPPAPLATASSQLLPAMYAPVQRLLLREVACGGAHRTAEEINPERLQSPIDSGDSNERNAGGYSKAGEGSAHDNRGAGVAEAVGEGSKEEDLGAGFEDLRGLDTMQSGATRLITVAPAPENEPTDAAASPLRSGTAHLDSSLRSVGGRPQYLPAFPRPHNHHTHRSASVSSVSSPSAAISHHHPGYHSTSPYLQPASLEVCRTTSPFLSGTGVEKSGVQPPESGTGAVLPPRLPSGGEGSRPHVQGVGGGSREGNGTAVTMQQYQRPPIVSNSIHDRSYLSPDLDGGRSGAVMERPPGYAEEFLLDSHQGNRSGGCNNLNLSQRQQSQPQQSAGAGGGTSGGRVGPGGASTATSPGTAVYGATFLSTPSQSTAPFSIGPVAGLGSATQSLTAPPPQHQQQRAAHSGVPSRGATSPPGGSQPVSIHGPSSSTNNISGSGHHVTSPASHHYTHPGHSNGYHNGGSQLDVQAGGHHPMPASRPLYIYEHHVGQELLLEEYNASMRFCAASFGNIACLVDALSPMVPVASDLEFPCNEDQCQLLFPRGSRDFSSPPGGGGSQHGSAQGGRSSRGGTVPVIASEDAQTMSGEVSSSMNGGCRSQGGLAPRPAHADRTRYWDFTGPSYSEPIMTLKSIWQSFDHPFGCMVNLAEPIYPAPMRPAEGELVYTPLLSGFRIRFHPASPAYKRLAALREVRRQRRREEEAAARASTGGSVEEEPATAGVEGAACSGGSNHASGSYAEEDGVLTWSATDRPNNRSVIMEQIAELARCDESYAELLTATTADVDHQSWVALMWQPVFCGGHSSKHSCGTFLAYYLLRAPRHLFLPFSHKSEGAAMNSSWDSPVFRGDRAALSFDIWGLQRHYHIARWASTPPMTHIIPDLSVAGEDEDPDNASLSCVSTSRGRNFWEEGQTGCTSNHTTESLAFSTNGDSRPRLRDVDAGSTAAGAVGASTVAPPYATTGTASAAAGPAAGTAAMCVRIPLVGLIPNRCRSEVWYKPLYDPSLIDLNHPGGGNESVLSGADVAGPGAARGGIGMGLSNGLGGAGGLGGGTRGNSGYHAGLCAFHAPLFLLVTALQLMCWDAYNEWERRSPTSAAPTTQPSTLSDGKGDAEGSDVATSGTARAPDTPSFAPCTNALPATVVTIAAAPRHHQQSSGNESDLAFAPGIGNGNSGQSAAARYPDSLLSYLAKGVELMMEAARQYRTMREIANLDAAVEEGCGSGAVGANNGGGSAGIAGENGINSAEEKRLGGGDKGTVKQPRGGCAIVAGGTNSALCDPFARVIAGLLDYYQWAQYDTSLAALAMTYCAT
ncbi:hypothetical protein JKF63_04235 [Porcisia hertigi]|uniref:Uncharacterized protein n=1 Tax=Porcisia hertigi TaxID=2761500 RepID=A0A836LB79_9TRYP|nr:hypothetical protein JKF63_04235 [Porcisia hertigi]